MLQGKGGFWRGTKALKEHPENKTAGNELKQGRLMCEVVIEGKQDATEPAAAKPCTIQRLFPWCWREQSVKDPLHVTAHKAVIPSYKAPLRV